MRAAALLLARNVAWLGVGEVGTKGGLFIVGVLVARGMGPEGMGIFTVAFGVALVLQQILAAGQPEVVIREVARSPELAGVLATRSFGVQTRVAVFALPVVVVLAMAAVPDSVRTAVVAFVPYAWLRARSTTLASVFKGLDRMDVDMQGRMVEIAVALPLLVFSAWAGMPVWGVGLVMALGALASGVWFKARLSRRFDASPAQVLSSGFLRRQGLPFMGGTLALQLLIRVDAFLLAALGVGEGEIGRFGVAHAITWGAVGISQLLAVALYPTISRMVQQRTLGLEIVLALGIGGGVLGACEAAVLYLIREPLVTLAFGVDFAPAAGLLAILVWLLPGMSAAMLLGIVLAARGWQLAGMILRVAVVVAAIVADLVLIPQLAAAGAAFVGVGSHTFAGLMLLVIAGLSVRQGRAAEATV